MEIKHKNKVKLVILVAGALVLNPIGKITANSFASKPILVEDKYNFQQMKANFINKLNSYYSKDAIENKEIRERISYAKNALDSLDEQTYNKIKEKLNFNGDTNEINDKEFESMVVFGVYYPFWIFFGSEKAKEFVFSDKFPNIIIADWENREKISRHHCQYIDIKAKEYPNTVFSTMMDSLKLGVRQDFFINLMLLNNIMHETAHASGYTSSNGKLGFFNEFATGFLMHFYFPIKLEEARKYEFKDYFSKGARNPMNTALSIKKEDRMDFFLSEYLNYLLVWAVSADLSKEEIINCFRIKLQGDQKFLDLIKTHDSFETDLEYNMWKLRISAKRILELCNTENYKNRLDSATTIFEIEKIFSEISQKLNSNRSDFERISKILGQIQRYLEFCEVCISNDFRMEMELFFKEAILTKQEFVDVVHDFFLKKFKEKMKNNQLKGYVYKETNDKNNYCEYFS